MVELFYKENTETLQSLQTFPRFPGVETKGFSF